MRDIAASTALLGWYDRNARDLPWRVGPMQRKSGASPDPYRVWLSEVMLQQTTVAAVRGYFERFVTLWPDVSALAAAEDGAVMGEWAGLGYYARARNLLKCARVVANEHGGRFPETCGELRALPGIGPYTAAAIAAIAFDERATVVDGNVERVMARLHAVETPLPAAKKELARLAELLTPATRPGCHAQAVMDLGATVCTPRSPSCGICPIRELCAARAAGSQAELPRRLKTKAKPTRLGFVYVARRSDGSWLLERRPDSGLLGGMLGWPGSDWSETPEETPPLEAEWCESPVEIRHTFTHFHLQLSLRTAVITEDAKPVRGSFMPDNAFRPSQLPSVMRKVYDVASDALSDHSSA